MEPNQTDTQAPVTPEAPKAKTSYGLLASLLVIVAIIVLGALYFLNERVSKDPAGTVDTLSTQGTSTEASAIEEDLSAQSPDEFDKELDDAFVELDAAFDAEAQ